MDDLKAHEKLCLERQQNILDRLERGSARMNRLELSVWAIYPWILGVMFLNSYFG